MCLCGKEISNSYAQVQLALRSWVLPGQPISQLHAGFVSMIVTIRYKLSNEKTTMAAKGLSWKKHVTKADTKELTYFSSNTRTMKSYDLQDIHNEYFTQNMS